MVIIHCTPVWTPIWTPNWGKLGGCEKTWEKTQSFQRLNGLKNERNGAPGMRRSASKLRCKFNNMRVLKMSNVYQKISEMFTNEQVCKACNDACRNVFDYIEMFYNPKCRHANNGCCHPLNLRLQQNEVARCLQS